MASYLQYNHEARMYEEKKRASASQLRAEQKRVVFDAVAEFRERTKFRREAILWDWCPIWFVVTENASMMQRLPPLPWCHDGDLRTPVPFLLSLHNYFRVYGFL
jgi:hypothetical protein